MVESKLSSHENRRSLTPSDLAMSIKSAWADSKIARNTQQQHLGHFFLHGVHSTDDKEKNPTESSLQSTESEHDAPRFKLASTLWLPGSSVAKKQEEIIKEEEEEEEEELKEEEEEEAVELKEEEEELKELEEEEEEEEAVELKEEEEEEFKEEEEEELKEEEEEELKEEEEEEEEVELKEEEEAEEQDEFTKPDEPLLPRPSTRDCYYDDTDSDSEPENEREEFISSRLGMARESILFRPTSAAAAAGGASRPASTHPEGAGLELEEEEMEQEKTERDKIDRKALDELAWELASTVECEGRLTRCQGDFDDEEEEGNSGALASKEEEKEEEGGEEGEVSREVMDMSTVISEFELYQKQLMEEESDQEL